MTLEHATPASGTHTTNGTPHGYSTITPFIAVADPTRALDFYESVFGATQVNVFRMGEQVVHAELAITSGRLQLGAASTDHKLAAPPVDSDTVTYSFGLYCADVDATVERALAAGATLREPVQTFVSGDRYGSLRDPFGVRWSVMTRVKDLSDTESQRRVGAWIADQASAAEQ